MTQNTDPFAMVRPASSAQVGLLALGWTVTDTLDGWDHMEPPGGPPVLLRRTLDAFEPAVEHEMESRITLREVNKGPLDMLVVTAEDLDADGIEELRKQVDMALQDPDFSIVANFDIDLTVVRGLEGANQPIYKNLCAVEIIEVGDELVSGWVHDPLIGTYSEQWLQIAFHDGPPKVGERLIKSTELRRQVDSVGEATMLQRATAAQTGGALLFDCEPHLVSGIEDTQSFWCFQLDPDYSAAAVADLRSQGRLVDHPELGHPAVVVRPEDSLDSWRALGWTLNEKCEQCRYPWHDGICACGGWGVDEERRAEEWHKAHPDGRE